MHKQTRISYTAEKGHLNVVQYLAEKGAKDEYEQTPISWAAQEGQSRLWKSASHVRKKKKEEHNRK